MKPFIENKKYNIDKEQEKVLDTIKACIASTQDHLTIDQLHRDYQQLIGSSIPFRSFHHGSLASFLQAFPKVIRVINRGGVLFVAAVPNEQDIHLQQLVRGQKRSKSRGNFSRPNQVIRGPRTSNWTPPFNPTRPYRGVHKLPSFSSSNVPYRQPNKVPLLPPPKQYPNSINGSYYNNNAPKPSTTNSISGSFYNSNAPKPSTNAISGNYYNSNAPKPSTNAISGSYYNSNAPKPSTNAISGNYYNSNPTKPTPTASTSRPVDKVSVPKASPPLHQDAKKASITSYKDELEKEAKRKGLSGVIYETIQYGKKKNYWVSTLQVDKRRFSSYPDEIKDKNEAEEIVAKKALESIKGILKPSTLEKTANFDIASQRIKEILNKLDCEDLWWEHIRECYCQEFHETIPADWVKEAQAKGIKGISINQPKDGLWTLRRLSETQSQASPEPTSESPKKDETMPKSQVEPSPLTLPEDKMWYVFVTYLKDCSELWFRLVGKEYSDEFENLVTDMELHYMEKSNLKPVTDPVIDSYYVISFDESWFRVRLTGIEGDKVIVFFIDHGDNETVSTTTLFHIEPKFLQLPSQSISACLAGFECGLSDPMLYSAAQNLALGKTLVAEVLSRGEVVSVVLYDTSTQEDININERLLQMLPQAYPEPAFPQEGGLCEVYVSNVTSGGDIYIKIESASYKVLQSLLITAKKRAAEILGEEIVTIDLGKLYLAKFSPDGDWQRAAPRSPNRDPDGKVLLEALDLGILGRVSTANMVPLEALSHLLCKIPAQSLLCRLHKVPSAEGHVWSQKASQRLASLFPRRDEPLLLKVMKEGKEGHPTLVELFQRVQPQNLLVSINATLDMDSSLFSNEDKNNNHNCEEDDSPNCQSDLEKLSLSPVAGGPETLQDLGSPLLPDVNTFFDVFVTYAASPSHFAVQSWKDTLKLEWLMAAMKEFYSNSANLKSVDKLHEGGFYALSHWDESWYRVRIDRVVDELVSGVFVDFGDCFCSSVEKIQTLWPKFRLLNYQAFKAGLGGIVPKNGDWTPEDSCRFRELVENRSFVSIVTQVTVGDKQTPPTLVLRLVDTQDPTLDVYIEDLLVREGRAKRCTQDTDDFLF